MLWRLETQQVDRSPAASSQNIQVEQRRRLKLYQILSAKHDKRETDSEGTFLRELSHVTTQCNTKRLIMEVRVGSQADGVHVSGDVTSQGQGETEPMPLSIFTVYGAD